MTRQTTTVPEHSEDWHRVIDIVSAATESYGLGAVTLDNFDPRSAACMADYLGSTDLDEQWMWSGTAVNEPQWFYVSLTDVDRDRSGKAADEMEGSIDYGWQPRSISISYGATALPGADRQEFIERLRPFDRLKRPDATSSD